jgi:outer membrane protein assembly factor BamA
MNRPEAIMQPVIRARRAFPSRWRHRILAAVGALLLLLPTAAGLAQTAPADAVPDLTAPRALFLEDIQLSGTGRTSLATVYKFLPLRPGQPIDQATLVAGVEELRQSGLFREVDFYTRPGASRGHLVLVLEVRDHALDFRWAAGNTNLDGWYLVPVMLAYDNPTGRGDLLDLQWRIGFRHTGLLLRYGQPRAGDGRDYWGLRLATISTDRPWFQDGVEYRHEVQNSGLAGVWGRRFGPRWLGEFGLNVEGVKVADHATASTQSADGSVSDGDKIYGDDLPPGIRDAVGDDGRAIFHFDLQHDTRTGQRRAGTPVSGLWGRLKLSGTAQGASSHAGLQADFRGYRESLGGVLALRLRGAVVSEHALFYDRLYLGGMYSVRGFPTNSLSAPGGDTWLWSGSLEHRGRILGDAKGTKLAGVLFLDGGTSGEFDGDAFGGVSAGAGYGLRLRVWWLDWIGLDIGFPLTTRPTDERFQVNASIGWSF